MPKNDTPPKEAVEAVERRLPASLLSRPDEWAEDLVRAAMGTGTLVPASDHEELAEHIRRLRIIGRFWRRVAQDLGQGEIDCSHLDFDFDAILDEEGTSV